MQALRRVRPFPFPTLLAALLLIAAFTSAIHADDETQSKPVGGDLLPTAEDVIARHIEAMGGADALRQHEHRTQTGQIDIPALQISGKLTIYGSAPNFFLMVADLGQHGINRTGFDGATAWSIDEINGPQIFKTARLEELRRQADFYKDLNYGEHYKSMAVRGPTEFESMPVFELKMIDRTDKDVSAYFHVESGLLVGLKGTAESEIGPIATTTHFADYESFDGVLLPTRLDTTFRDILQRITIEKVSHERIKSDTFDLPEEIAAIQETENVKNGEAENDQASEDSTDDVNGASDEGDL